jgi:hypothetical protein
MCITKISWRGGGVYLGGSLEGKWTFGGHTDISLEVAAQLEREGGEERGRANPYAPKGVSDSTVTQGCQRG